MEDRPLRLGDRVEWTGPSEGPVGSGPQHGERGWLIMVDPADDIIMFDVCGHQTANYIHSPGFRRVGNEPDPEKWLGRSGPSRAVPRRVELRAAFQSQSSGATPHVEEALVVLAAGGLSPGALPDAVRAVRELHESMHRHRMGRLRSLGFGQETAEAISELHTANFM